MTREEAKVRAWARQQSKKWDCSPEGRSNSSELFLHLTKEVERIIRGDAFMLLNGGANSTARLIMAQLAHKHGLRPANRAQCGCRAKK